MATHVSDNFNRADETPLASPWGSCQSSTYGELLSGNAAKGGLAYNRAGSYYNSTFTDAQYAQCEQTEFGAIGPAVRVMTTQRSGYFFAIVSSTIARMYKIHDGTVSQLGADYTGTYTVGATIKLTADGSTLTPYVNDTALGTRTDTTFTSGKVGIMSASSTNKVDNWYGGDGPGVPASGNRRRRLIICGGSR